jgi:hypothetical protein
VSRGRSLERTAYHEAGHAVAHYLCNARFKWVAIFDPEKGPPINLLAKVLKKVGSQFYKNRVAGRLERIKCWQRLSNRDLIFIGLAGMAAEAIRYRDCLGPLLTSQHEVALIEPFRCGLSLDYWYDEARSRLRKDIGVWNAVKVLAGELLTSRRIPYKRAVEIIDQAILEDAKKFRQEKNQKGEVARLIIRQLRKYGL